MKIPRGTSRKARVEMLPLIDIVFLLLVFFIYAMLSMAVHRGLPVELPVSAEAVPDQELLLAVTVNRTPDGPDNIYLGEEQVELEQLADRLRERMTSEQGREAGVLLFADRQVEYQGLFRVLDQINRAGLSRISLQADAEH